MAIAKRLRKALVALLAVLGILLWLVALLLFTQVAENSADFSRRLFWILLINSIGIGVLIVLVIVNLAHLIRDYRRHVPGSRLRARMVALLVLLAVTPLVGVYAFSVQFINRGIDNWFNLDVQRGLEDALELGQTALDVFTRDRLEYSERIAARLAATERADIVGLLSELRNESGALELTLYGANRQILAKSSEYPDAAVPLYPSEEVLLQLRQSRPYASIELQPDDQYQILATVPLPTPTPRGEFELLQATFPIEQRLSTLANQVQRSHDQYAALSFVRPALKTSFTLTLSLVLAISLLASVYGAFYFARRLVVPIQQLMQATRAVARGDFDTRVQPTPARDEIGFLVNSFNDMTQRLAKASQEARSSQQTLESERKKLEVILARLSTGVVSLEPDMRIRTANQAAGAILGVDLESYVGQSLVELAKSRPLLAQFLSVEANHLAHGDREWREQIVLRTDIGRRVLMCACTDLPADGETPSGYVIVFDDITALLQAQRDAAWGEVARRLAHEIKNPLTPIQLSAERLRRRYLKSESTDGELLDRATHTIIQQVESMKEMVNAFSEYARTPLMEVTRFDVNALIAEVSELYAHQERPLAIKLSLAANLPPIEADAGRLRQVFHNLLRNALEAMEHQNDAAVEISTRRVPGPDFDNIEIKVSDNGPGFLSDIVHQAFEPYVTSKTKGTGLGLAIVKKLVEEHGGQIGARNREQGGAEISILIPISVEADETSLGRRHDHRRERA
jgi:PAS domain S-box-containing protein